MGAVKLARREYTEALEALLCSGFWMDAAYVAERVLTIEELKSYTERNWPELSPATNAPGTFLDDTGVIRRATPVEETTANLRYLLGRRLLRQQRFEEARPFFPTALLAAFDDYHTNLVTGRTDQISQPMRAAALWRAAQTLRTNGMELIGTEVEPDWHIHGGDFEVGVSVASRTNAPQLLQASADEVNRATRAEVKPDERFHYRYVAADLAWEAAKLMPNNTGETARVLCVAGSWLKNRDPAAADVFYKALVRRCRQTALGAEADRKRWFPVLDETGNLETHQPPSIRVDEPVNPATQESLELAVPPTGR
jgi:hypothetical protein